MDKLTVESRWNDKYLVDRRQIDGELVDRKIPARTVMRRSRGLCAARAALVGCAGFVGCAG